MDSEKNRSLVSKAIEALTGSPVLIVIIVAIFLVTSVAADIASMTGLLDDGVEERIDAIENRIDAIEENGGDEGPFYGPPTPTQTQNGG